MTYPMDLAGRGIVVTGASSGIGRETAILLSQLGASVILTGRDPQRR
jgi:NAD(P)-dependent dehydrogenase (short-subunit alcohol dehydrogenase family)